MSRAKLRRDRPLSLAEMATASAMREQYAKGLQAAEQSKQRDMAWYVLGWTPEHREMRGDFGQ